MRVNKKLLYGLIALELLQSAMLVVVSALLVSRSIEMHHVMTTGDINDDGKVDVLDLSIMEAHWSKYETNN